MFTPPGYRRKLQADIERWVEGGLISRSSAEAILGDYRASRFQDTMLALAFVFAIFAASGLIAGVAANWQQIPREIRVAGLLSLNVAVLALCLFFTLKRNASSIGIETSAALAVMSAGASLSLIGQIYHFPANWPGFGFAMMIIAGATAMVARSSACIWMSAMALMWFDIATLAETKSLLLSPDAFTSSGAWTEHEWVVFSASLALVALAVTGWTARSGPWTILIASIPLFWLVGGRGMYPHVAGRPLVWCCGAIVVLTLLSWEGRHSERLRKIVPAGRLDAAVSAMLGLFVILLWAITFQTAAWLFAPGMLPHPRLGVSIPVCLIGFGLAALMGAAAVRLQSQNPGLVWMAAALGSPFLAEMVFQVVIPGGAYPSTSRGDGASAGELARLVFIVLLPLALVSVEARISERRKTFVAGILALIVIVGTQLWTSGALLNLSAMLFASAGVVLFVLLLLRFGPSWSRRSAAEGAP